MWSEHMIDLSNDRDSAGEDIMRGHHPIGVKLTRAGLWPGRLLVPARLRRIGVGFVVAVCSVIYPAVGFSQKAPDPSMPASKEWLTIGGDWHNTRYSTVTQITRNNVKNLTGTWVTHLGSGLGQKYSFEGTPIVKDGILYIATGNDDVFALDGRTGALIWEHRSGIEQNTSTVCCGWDNRGVAVGDGKVFLG